MDLFTTLVTIFTTSVFCIWYGFKVGADEAKVKMKKELELRRIMATRF